MKEEIRNKFNVTAAIEEFKSLEGLPYGIHNFIFGWIDTPSANFPPLLSPELAIVVFSILEKIDAGLVKTFLGEGLNFRLNTTVFFIIIKIATIYLNIIIELDCI